MSTYKLISEVLAKQSLQGDTAVILEKVQYLFAKELGINVSLHALINFFLGRRMPAEDDQLLRDSLRENGYKFPGGWEENQQFWKGILTKDEYDKITAEHSIMMAQGARGAEENEEIDWKKEAKLTKKDYNLWLRVVKAEGRTQNVNINVKSNFEDVAFDLLDNDSKIDLLSGDTELAKRTIVDVLWRMHHVEKAVNKAREVNLGLNLRPAGYEDEETNLDTPELTPNVEPQNPNRSKTPHVLLHVEQEGYEAATADYNNSKQGATNCPYATGSLRGRSWQEGYDRGEYELWGDREPSQEDDTMTDTEADADVLKSAGMGTDEDYGRFSGDEDEEDTSGYRSKSEYKRLSTVMKEVEEDGRRACEQAYIKALDGNKSVKHPNCPHPANTRAYNAWMKGYNDTKKVIEGSTESVDLDKVFSDPYR